MKTRSIKLKLNQHEIEFYIKIFTAEYPVPGKIYSAWEIFYGI